MMMVITAEGGTERREGGAPFMALGANAERADADADGRPTKEKGFHSVVFVIVVVFAA